MKKLYTLIPLAFLLSIISVILTYKKDIWWIGHGTIGIVSLIIVVSIVIAGATLKGRIKRITKTNTLKLHKWLAISFGFFILGVFLYGLWVTTRFGKIIPVTIHGKLGLFIFIVVISQVIPSLLIKKRTKLRTIHRILGYTLISLVILQVTWGIHVAVIGRVKSLILIHSIAGSIVTFALIWIIVEMRHLTEKGILRAKRVSYIAAFFNIVGCWAVGGYDYLVAYNSQVKPIINSGVQSWAHQVFMEAKGDIFIFLPIISLVLTIILITLSHDNTLINDSKSRRSVITIASLSLFMVLLMVIMGAIVSNAGMIGGA